MMDKTKDIMEVFNRCANEYQAKFMDISMYHPSLDVFCENIAKENASILELACGPGNISKYLFSKRPDVKLLGLDIAPNMIELAKHNNPTAFFEEMDCRDIATLKEQYDGIVCGFGLPYLSKEEAIKLIADAYVLLKEKGVLYISTMEDEYEKSGLKKSSSGEYELFMYFHEAGYLVEALEGNGFKVVDVRRYDFPLGDGTKMVDLVIVAEKYINIK